MQRGHVFSKSFLEAEAGDQFQERAYCSEPDKDEGKSSQLGGQNQFYNGTKLFWTFLSPLQTFVEQSLSVPST